MKKILFIATGGTIASAKTENGLTPAITSEELLNAVPQVKNLCAVDTVQPYSLDSTNMCWKQWIHVAEIIRDSYAKYDGFVIAHGTDTLSYAAATLSYLIQKNEKPVVLTGAQKSIEVPDGDARRNLFEAFVYATDARACGTHVVFNGHVIAGTRARKTHTKSFDAFSSIDFPDIGVFYDKKLLCYIDERPECPGAVFYDKLVPEILSIRVIPGMDPSVFDYITAHCRGVVIESFGVGGIPYYGDNAFEEKIAALMENGVRVVITTQVPHEGSNLSVYRVGHIIKEKYRVLEASNMTTEAVIAKMMWALAYSETREEFEKDMLKSYETMRKAGIEYKDAPIYIPPYEYYNKEIAAWAKNMGIQVVNYTPGTMSNADYTTPDMGQKYRSSKFIYNKIMEVEKKEGLNGHLMLIHFGTDNRRTDKFYNSYLDKLIKTLKRKGYTFTPILEAIGIKTNSAL